jgi:hypothetical protein
MDIAIPLFEGITALDAIGPYEVLSRLPGARVRFVGLTPGPPRSDNRQLALVADEPLSAVPHRPTRSWTGFARLTRPVTGPPRSARVHCSWARRGSSAGSRPRPTGWPSSNSASWARARRRGASSSRTRSSLRPACRPASTWPSPWPRASPATRSRRPSSWVSSTIRSHRFSAGSPQTAPPHVVEKMRERMRHAWRARPAEPRGPESTEDTGARRSAYSRA